jgi:ATP-dependent Clp protease ATP-binding subunit ClpA
MFERYTEKARRVIFYARYEASQFGASAIETEHLLLGLLREHKVIVELYLPSAALAQSIPIEIEARTPRNKKTPISVDLKFSDESKRALAFAAEEAECLAHKHIGTEHLLLGLLREEVCFAAQLLGEGGGDLQRIRRELAEAPTRQQLKREEISENTPFGQLLKRSKVFNAQQTSRAAENPGPGMKIGFEAYTESARRALFFARYEASHFGSPNIETEHLLLGLMRQAKEHRELFFPSPAAPDNVRKQIEAHTIIREKVSTSVDLPLSNEVKRALANGAEEAKRLATKHIAVEHLLLGLLGEEGSFAARILREQGAEPDSIRGALATAPQTPAED